MNSMHSHKNKKINLGEKNGDNILKISIRKYEGNSDS